MSYRSHEILQGPGYANVRALYKADGYAEEELKRPIIGIANAYNSICPGHIVLRQMAERIREGIQAAGGMPIEFGTIGACDGIAMGHEGMRYILPAREMIANDVEAMVQAHRLDGIVLLGSCDKIIPGMLIGAMRVNLPAIFINGGPSLPGHMADGNPYGGEWIDHSCIQQSEGALQAEKITEKEFKWIEDNAMPTVGSCAMLGTANTMGCLAEAMGIMLPGSATIPAVYSKRMAAAYNSGKAIVDLVHKNIRIQDIITKRALANAIMVNSAMGGSTNAVLHLLAIAHSGKINLTIDDFETISSGIQHLVAMIPAGKYTLFDFFEAGGVQALMKEMEEKLYVDALTCTGDGSYEVSMNKILGNKTAIAAFVAPSLILFGGIIFYSIIMSFRYSLLDWNGFGEGIFVGFSNYAKMFQDKVFLRSAVNSLLLGFVTLVTQLPLALLLALLLTSGIKGEGFYRTVFFIPMTLSSVVIGQLWLKIYNPNYGVLNTLLGVLGLESLQRSWLGDVNTALFSAFVPIIWQNVGYHMLLLYTSINSISKDILEAAKLDGASGVKAARYITIPLVKPMLRTCAIFVVIGSLKAFDMIYVLTNGGPAHMTEVPSSLMFSSIFNLNKYGYGSAISIFIVVECIVMAVILQKVFLVKEESA